MVEISLIFENLAKFVETWCVRTGLNITLILDETSLALREEDLE